MQRSFPAVTPRDKNRSPRTARSSAGQPGAGDHTVQAMWEGWGCSSSGRMLLWAVKSQKQANNCVIIYLGVLRQQVSRGCLDALGE